VSIGVDEVTLWCLVVGTFAAERETPLKSCQRFPTLLEVLDFQPGVMVKVVGQPMEGREGSEIWDMLVKREEKDQREGARGS